MPELFLRSLSKRWEDFVLRMEIRRGLEISINALSFSRQLPAPGVSAGSFYQLGRTSALPRLRIV
jgi:hypothetical protein